MKRKRAKPDAKVSHGTTPSTSSSSSSAQHAFAPGILALPKALGSKCCSFLNLKDRVALALTMNRVIKDFLSDSMSMPPHITVKDNHHSILNLMQNKIVEEIKITGATPKNFKQTLKNIRTKRLLLHKTKCDGTGLFRSLAEMKYGKSLVTLEFDGCELGTINDKGPVHWALNNLSSLTSLKWMNTEPGADPGDKQRVCPLVAECQSLCVHCRSGLCPAGYCMLASAQILHIQYTAQDLRPHNPSVRFLPGLERLVSLEHLHYHCEQELASALGFIEICSHLHMLINLRSLVINIGSNWERKVPNLTPSFQQLRDHSGLNRLKIHWTEWFGTAIDESHIAHLAQSKSLTDLDLELQQLRNISGTCLEAFVKPNKLQSLKFNTFG